MTFRRMTQNYITLYSWYPLKTDACHIHIRIFKNTKTFPSYTADHLFELKIEYRCISRICTYMYTYFFKYTSSYISHAVPPFLANLYVIHIINNMSQCIRLPTMWHFEEPLQPPFKLRNSKWCSVSSLTIIEYSSDKQRL